LDLGPKSSCPLDDRGIGWGLANFEISGKVGTIGPSWRRCLLPQHFAVKSKHEYFHRRVSVWFFKYCLLTLFQFRSREVLRCNGFVGSNDRNVMLHHHFLQLISPFHDAFVSGRAIAQFVRANRATKAITSHRAAPPGPAIRGIDILTNILIHDPIARRGASFERWQKYDLPGAREAGSSISNATSRRASTAFLSRESSKRTGRRAPHLTKRGIVGAGARSERATTV
jgi:hypothetical protein